MIESNADTKRNHGDKGKYSYGSGAYCPRPCHDCWDYTFDSFTNIIDVYVNYLRKKIDGKGDKKLIHTVRGVGYVFKEEE